MEHLWKGLVIGFAIAAPVGPIGLLCVRRAIADGRWAGFVTGLGAATADTIYGLLAALGVTFITDWVAEHNVAFRIFGSVFLIVLGVHMIRAKTAVRSVDQPVHAPSLHAAYFTTILLTLANPLTIASFTGIFAAFDLGGADQGRFNAARLVIGVFLGSTAWWLILSSSASWFGRKLNERGLRLINLTAGGLVLALGVWQAGVLVKHWL